MYDIRLLTNDNIHPNLKSIFYLFISKYMWQCTKIVPTVMHMNQFEISIYGMLNSDALHVICFQSKLNYDWHSVWDRKG